MVMGSMGGGSGLQAFSNSRALLSRQRQVLVRMGMGLFNTNL